MYIDKNRLKSDSVLTSSNNKTVNLCRTFNFNHM